MDYSKWDRIELSDDSDIEEHPNVDKGSMIRWRQAKIHRDRRDRKDTIETTRREIEMNRKAYQLLAQSPFGSAATARGDALGSVEQIVKVLHVLGFTFNAAETQFREQFEDMRFAEWNERWGPPTLLDFVEQRIRFEAWVRVLLARLGEVEPAAAPAVAPADGAAKPAGPPAVPEKEINAWKDLAPAEIVSRLRDAVEAMQKQIMARNEACAKTVEREEREAAKKLTSDNIGHVAKDSTQIASGRGAVIETIHTPGAVAKAAVGPASAPAEPAPAVEGDFATLPLVEEFSRITSLADSAEFVRQHLQLVSSDYNTGLLSLAFRAEMKGEHARARQCIHQATIINYCKELGAQNTPMFFKRLLSNKPEAMQVFAGDVKDTYERLHERVVALKEKERREEEAEVQLNEARLELATQPDGTLQWPIVEGQNDTPAEREKKLVFDKLPESFKRALILQDVDGINAHLGSLSREEQQATVAACSRVGIIQVEEE